MPIYRPLGEAGEYAEWAFNPFLGCTHGCLYCYGPNALHRSRADYHQPKQREGILAKLERKANRMHRSMGSQLITMSFATDPYFDPDWPDPGTSTFDPHPITRASIEILQNAGHKVCILTKGGERSEADFDILRDGLDEYATTLTFTPERTEQSLQWEPGAAPPQERIDALRFASLMGYRTWVSLEPVIDPQQTLALIASTFTFVDLYRIGKLNYHPHGVTIDWPTFAVQAVDLLEEVGATYQLKKSLLSDFTLSKYQGPRRQARR